MKANEIDDTILEQISAMKCALDKTRDRSCYGPSDFWSGLCEKHEELIRTWGFSRFKRSINFEYNQWAVGTFKSPQLWHVFWQLVAMRQFPFVALFAKSHQLEDAAWPLSFTPVPLAYKTHAGLLWQYAQMIDRLDILNTCEEPAMGDPLDVRYRGRLISQDLAMSCIELNTIAKVAPIAQIRTICEIGAGYGRLAYLTAMAFPGIEYCIFDIPPALAVSQNYLASVLGQDNVDLWGTNQTECVDASTGRKAVRSFLPHQLEAFPDRYFDIVINVSSLDEMTVDQIRRYFDLIDRKCNRWLYLKGYAARSGDDPTRPLGVTQFPYPEHWEKVYEGKDPTHQSFIERIYVVNE